MAVISGTTSGSVLSRSFGNAAKIISYSIVNKSTTTAVSYRLSIVLAGSLTHIRYRTLAAYESYSEECDIILNPSHEILITATGSIDYYFSVE